MKIITGVLLGTILSFQAVAKESYTLTHQTSEHGFFDFLSSNKMVKDSGVKESEDRELNEFRSIELRLPAEVEIRHSETFRVRVTADNNIIPVVVTDVANETLSITSGADFTTHQKISLIVEAPLVSDVTISGSGNISFGPIEQESLSIAISGSGNVSARGFVNSFDGRISGSGDLKLANLQTLASKVRIRGSGSVLVRAKDELDAKIYGSGDIYYFGRPKVLNTKVRGSGSIQKF